MEFTLHQIANLLKGEVRGDGNEKINMLAKIQEAKPGQIAFLANPKYEQYMYTTQASAVIVHKDFQPKRKINSSLILVEDPYSSFTVLMEQYHKMMSFQKNGVEQPSFLSDSATIGKDSYRGAFSYVGNNTRIGDNVKIFPQVFVGDDVTIGDNVILHPNVKIYARTRIGSNVIIHAGTVIGSDGFGFAPQDDGSYKSIPQMGNVVIEDDVTIGANTVIDCATLQGDSTIIRRGVKMDNLIQIAHNVEVGKNTVIAAQTGISGSTKVGENCMIAGQVGIAGHIELANHTSLGAQSGVSKSITEEGERLMGYPAIDVKAYFRSYAVYKKLPELWQRVRDLEKKLDGADSNTVETPENGQE